VSDFGASVPCLLGHTRHARSARTGRTNAWSGFSCPRTCGGHEPAVVEHRSRQSTAGVWHLPRAERLSSYQMGRLCSRSYHSATQYSHFVPHWYLSASTTRAWTEVTRISDIICSIMSRIRRARGISRYTQSWQPGTLSPQQAAKSERSGRPQARYVRVCMLG
jgi:hypothetical protein